MIKVPHFYFKIILKENVHLRKVVCLMAKKAPCWRPGIFFAGLGRKWRRMGASAAVAPPLFPSLRGAENSNLVWPIINFRRCNRSPGRPSTMFVFLIYKIWTGTGPPLLNLNEHVQSSDQGFNLKNWTTKAAAVLDGNMKLSTCRGIDNIDVSSDKYIFAFAAIVVVCWAGKWTISLDRSSRLAVMMCDFFQ